MEINYILDKEIGYNYLNKSKPFRILRGAPIRVCIGKRKLYFMIPAGFSSDGCSIPKLARFFLGCPHTPEYVPASIIHDYILEHPEIVRYDRREASEIFFNALLKEGVNPPRAVIMFLAVDLWQAVKNLWTEKWV